MKRQPITDGCGGRNVCCALNTRFEEANERFSRNSTIPKWHKHELVARTDENDIMHCTATAQWQRPDKTAEAIQCKIFENEFGIESKLVHLVEVEQC